MENTNFRILEQAVHCFYNPRSNEWGEYKWSEEMNMFAYAIYSNVGRLQQGFMGIDAITDKKKVENWVFIGCL